MHSRKNAIMHILFVFQHWLAHAPIIFMVTGMRANKLQKQ